MLLKRLIDKPLVFIALAALLAVLPLLNWLGLVLIVLLLLRHGSWLGLGGYVFVAVVTYWAFSGYSIEMIRQDYAGFFAMFLPLLVIALALRVTRAMNLSLELGFASLVFIILLQTLLHGQPSLQAWIEFFRCRLQAMGVADSQLLALTNGQSFEHAVRGLMLGWPFAFLLTQVNLLFLARWWQALMFYPGGFQAEFHQLRLHKPVALVLGLFLLVLGFIGTEQVVLIQLASVGLLFLAIPGLALVHWYVKFKALNRWWLLLVYLMLFISSFAALPLLAMIAVLDSGLNIRLRMQSRAK